MIVCQVVNAKGDKKTIWPNHNMTMVDNWIDGIVR